ncbi:MAG: hypothetical protein ACYC26_15620 [Phycisphaerales bacterium]
MRRLIGILVLGFILNGCCTIGSQLANKSSSLRDEFNPKDYGLILRALNRLCFIDPTVTWRSVDRLPFEDRVVLVAWYLAGHGAVDDWLFSDNDRFNRINNDILGRGLLFMERTADYKTQHDYIIARQNYADRMLGEAVIFVSDNREGHSDYFLQCIITTEIWFFSPYASQSTRAEALECIEYLLQETDNSAPLHQSLVTVKTALLKVMAPEKMSE